MDILQGRQMQPTGPTETLTTENEASLSYDYDSTPLHPGIESVLSREETETNEATAQQLFAGRSEQSCNSASRT